MVILYYHTLAFENRADSVKKHGDIIFFYLFGVFEGWDAKREYAPQTSAKDTLPFLSLIHIYQDMSVRMFMKLS